MPPLDFPRRKILLIAYEYPPSPSPQSLRWAYLSRELARAGHEVHVLTIDLGGTSKGLPELPDDIVVHRTYPGPFRGLVAAFRKHRHRRRNASEHGKATGTPEANGRQSRGGWKHILSLAIQRSFEFVVFPDMRGEWYLPATGALRRLLQDLQPDLVISSHEPATTLQLGLRARERGVRWLADLGDPVLAPYTPARWRGKAHRLEQRVCHEADHVLVTAESARDLMLSRYQGAVPITVLTQGFDDTRADPAPTSGNSEKPLELLYTGSFYSFRRVDSLVSAVLDTPGVRLNIASIAVPELVRQASEAHPERIRLLGFLPHDEALAWQLRADILINLANADPSQVPGKFYEYLGSGRPLLHLGQDPHDVAASLVSNRRRGWVCTQEREALTAKLRELLLLHEHGKLMEGLCLSRAEVAEFSWSSLGVRLCQIIDEVLATRT